MPQTPKRPAETQEAQSERFVAMARELGADESEERFNAKLKKVAGAKVVPEAAGTEIPAPKKRD